MLLVDGGSRICNQISDSQGRNVDSPAVTPGIGRAQFDKHSWWKDKNDDCAISNVSFLSKILQRIEKAVENNFTAHIEEQWFCNNLRPIYRRFSSTEKFSGFTTI